MPVDPPEAPWRVDTAAPWWSALLELHLHHAHAIDDDRLEDWPGLYAEHALYRIDYTLSAREVDARGACRC